MNRTRALILSLAVALAAIAGVFALGHTARARRSRPTPTTDRQVARRTAQLDRYEASLRRRWRRSRRALPPLPATAPQRRGALQSARRRASSITARRRSSSIKHRAGGEEDERASRGR